MSTSCASSGRRKYVDHRRRQMIFRKFCIISAIILSTIILIGTAGIHSHAEGSDEIHYYKYYTSVMVMPGDTLSSIASAYGEHYDDTEAHIREIMLCNHLGEDVIYAGTYLIVPYYSSEFTY